MSDDDSDVSSPTPLRWMHRVHLRTVTIAQWMSEPSAEGVEPSPYIDWTHYPSWGDFQAAVTSRRHKLVKDTQRCQRKLEREHGAIEFLFEDPDLGVLEQCFAWKSAQYRDAGFPDLFALPSNRRLFHELARRKSLVVSTLKTGGRVAAVHLGAVHNGRFYWWIPTYDRELDSYAPGRILLMAVLEETHKRGFREFDFLLGDEEYKWFYATHARVIDSVGIPPLSRRLKAAVRRELRANPRLQQFVRTARERMKKVTRDAP